MSSPEAGPELNKKARIDAVVALINARIQKGERASLTTFARGYFERVDPEDIAVREVEDLYGALLSHWQFARTRDSGAARFAFSIPAPANTAGNRATRSSRSSMTTCRFWSTRPRWKSAGRR